MWHGATRPVHSWSPCPVLLAALKLRHVRLCCTAHGDVICNMPAQLHGVLYTGGGAWLRRQEEAADHCENAIIAFGSAIQDQICL